MQKRVSHGDENGCSLQKLDRLVVGDALKSTTKARTKYMFSENHPDHESHIQQICRPEKQVIPVPVGPPLPHQDCEEDTMRYH